MLASFFLFFFKTSNFEVEGKMAFDNSNLEGGVGGGKKNESMIQGLK
jgi:hypothetical protein